MVVNFSIVVVAYLNEFRHFQFGRKPLRHSCVYQIWHLLRTPLLSPFERQVPRSTVPQTHPTTSGVGRHRGDTEWHRDPSEPESLVAFESLRRKLEWSYFTGSLETKDFVPTKTSVSVIVSDLRLRILNRTNTGSTFPTLISFGSLPRGTSTSSLPPSWVCGNLGRVYSPPNCEVPVRTIQGLWVKTHLGEKTLDLVEDIHLLLCVYFTEKQDLCKIEIGKV